MNKIYKSLISILVIVFIMSNTYSIYAVNQSEINSQTNLKNEVSNKIEDIEEKKEEVEAKKTEAMKQVESLNTQINSYESQIGELEDKIEKANEKIADAEKQLKENQKQYDDNQKLLEQRLVATYEAGDISYLDVILSSEGLTDFISNFYLVSEIAQHDTELLEEIQKEKEKIEKSKQEIEDGKKDLTDAKSSKESVAKELKTAKSEKTTYVNQLSAEEAKLEKDLDEYRNYESTINSKIAKMKKQYEAEQLAAQKAAASKTSSSSSSKTSSSSSSSSSGGSNSNGAKSSYGFGWPVANPVIGTGYGVSGRLWASGHHTGLDFRASTGTQVYSIGDGQVFDTGYSSAYGNYVEIYHGNNIYSFYAHGSRIQVSEGQRVSKGQAIMLSGATGNVTGAHLHFEIRSPGYRYANCVNPRKYLP